MQTKLFHLENFHPSMSLWWNWILRMFSFSRWQPFENAQGREVRQRPWKKTFSSLYPRPTFMSLPLLLNCSFLRVFRRKYAHCWCCFQASIGGQVTFDGPSLSPLSDKGRSQLRLSKGGFSNRELNSDISWYSTIIEPNWVWVKELLNHCISLTVQSGPL